jgi:hypothetical protein
MIAEWHFDFGEHGPEFERKTVGDESKREEGMAAASKHKQEMPQSIDAEFGQVLSAQAMHMACPHRQARVNRCDIFFIRKPICRIGEVAMPSSLRCGCFGLLRIRLRAINRDDQFRIAFLSRSLEIVRRQLY